MRFGAGDRALYASTGSNYRQVPIGVVIPRTIDDVVATVAVAPRARCADPLARRRHEPGRPVRATSPSSSTSPSTSTASSRSTRERRLARVQPGVVLDHLRDRGRAPLRPHLRPRSLDARPLHARRDDRQQLLRRPLGDGAVLRPRAAHLDNVAELEVLTYRGERHARRRTTATESSRRASPGTAAARSPTATATQIRERYPQDPAPRLRLQPRRAAARERLPRRPRARGNRGHLRHRARGDRSPDRQPAGAAASSSPATSTPRPPPTTCSRCSSTGRSALEGHRRHADRRHDAARPPPPRPLAAPRRQRLARDRGRRREQGRSRRQRPRDHRAASSRQAAACAARSSTTTPRARSTSGTCARPGSARPRSSPASPTPTRAGRTPPSRPSVSASTCASCKKLTGRYGYESAALRPLRPGLRPRPLELRPHERRGRRHLAPLHGRRRRPRPLARRLALRRARRRAVARRAPAQDVRPRARRAPSASSRRSGTPTAR